ncbi:glycosyltransferase family 2 protein [Flavobacterium sp. LS1R10]|uniref:glycosyltransferase family 2 protein n=1 Tax=Flavobacterium sp. LS1R10 TaxID=2497482 RepID=UPI000F8447DD|nr:glycosyltransferase family 2 protein [Flavobacterium sp. LS1R10]RTY76864.1 glycosyltransferase family 2 protein [Flavobacterium sp. LS1R10]RTY95472.1 glycosyltransferase family 2 protein [Flavobacterium sp. GSN2]
MTPLVSIIIPTYNRANLITETLNSVLKQTYFNWECIIIDDGSTDNSLVVIQKYLNKDSRFLYLLRPDYKKKGPSSCRNYGIEKVTGDYIIFLDSDDLLAITCLENRIEFAMQNLEYDFWIFKMAAFNNTINNFEFVYENIIAKNESLFCKKEFMKGNHPFVITGPLWKKSVLVELDGFNEQMTMIEDPELHLRALKKYRLKFSNYTEPDCFYRLNNFAAKRPVKLELENAFVFFNCHLNNIDRDLLVSFKKTINNLIFENKKYNYFIRFYILGNKLGILSNNKIFFGALILIYKSFGFDKFKGLGYHRFKKIFNNF